MAKFIDLTGQRFGKLIATSRAENDRYGHAQWNCTCDCGGTIVTLASCLRNGDTKRCSKETCSSLRLKNLTGQRFGKLLVIEKSKKKIKKDTLWDCLCDCGSAVQIGSYRLRQRKTLGCPSCVNRAFKDLTGKTFGKIKVISLAHVPHKRTRWNCICSCGEKMVVTSNNLLSSTECCVKCAIHRLPDDTLASKHVLFGRYKMGAKKRNLPFKLTFEEFMPITQKNCHYCGKVPAQYLLSSSKGILYNGIDRIYPDKGYEKSNVVPCCKNCNRLKGIQNIEQFLAWVKNFRNRLEIHHRMDMSTITQSRIIEKISGEPLLLGRRLYTIYRNVCAKKRNLPFDLKFEHFLALTQENCHYCGQSPQKEYKVGKHRGFFYNGLDRIDNTKGYDLSNVAPCCWNCNSAKSNLTLEEFQSRVEHCYKHLVSAD